ncbi:phage terminase large subunit [Eleftheria terrae]|uniref:phage terminase large subunit n=1 Tax=Eleftheria terrae TaxID=1597781 RepID=UPI00263ADBDC|nr:phage terminase large subunit [Eleftheria terrae]WKB53028.1 phage terminase large subunit [Eleftheria terrae]
MASREISFAAFYLLWGKHRQWKVPAVHVRVCHWMEHRGDLAVLRAHRGFSKSTILAVYNAWRYYRDPTYRILHQSEADRTAYKTSRDTQNVLRNHPLTRGMFREGGVQEWWVEGADDARNASMFACGILSNVTSARCDEAQNDDVEVPRNIQTPEAREKLRYRLGEQTHIMVPGGRQLFIGTPHTHDSLYDEKERQGADCLTVRMFEHEHRIEDAKLEAYQLPFVPEFVFAGIGAKARLLKRGKDYRLDRGSIVFAAPPGGLVDCYAGVAWPERFDGAELEKRRRSTRTINEWDSQYQLHSKPIHEVRLDPDRMKLYDVEPVFRSSNGQHTMWLGRTNIVSCSMRWDPSGGKLHSDVSALCLVLQDDAGRMYWHRAVALEGEIATFDDRGKIIGGQVWQICDVVEQLQVPRVTVETNGVGTHSPGLLKAALKARKLQCGVKDLHTTGNKNLRILSAFEPPLSGGYLWAHVSVYDQVAEKMRDWNPAVTEQPDDELDAAAAAMSDEPVRIGRMVGNPTPTPLDDWRPSAGVHEVELADAE